MWFRELRCDRDISASLLPIDHPARSTSGHSCVRQVTRQNRLRNQIAESTANQPTHCDRPAPPSAYRSEIRNLQSSFHRLPLPVIPSTVEGSRGSYLEVCA